jgi:glutathione peroxidase-family protein
MTAFHDLEMESITGETIAFSHFRDQMTLVVNVASK